MKNAIEFLSIISLAALTVAQGGCSKSGGEGGHARIAANGVMGEYHGTLRKGAESIANHKVEVLTDRAGAPTVTVWEFCNIEMEGAGPRYTAKSGATCLLNFGDGAKPRSVTGSANIADGRITVSLDFPNDHVAWTYEGSR